MRRLTISLYLLFLGALSLSAQSNIEIENVNENVYVLKGRGGNIGLCMGADGILMVDGQFADATPAILEEIAKINARPIEFLINTHHHGDHTGGNANVAATGTTIVAHKNVRDRLLGGRNSEAGNKVDRSALPIITFAKNMTFYYNNEEIEVFHVNKAHTDGDAIIYFKGSNVVHTGDVYFAKRYPYIDVNSGGGIEGAIQALKTIAENIEEDTKVIPGHGDIMTKNDIIESWNMLRVVKRNVTFHYLDKKTVEQVLNMPNITDRYDEKGWGDFYIDRETFIRLVYAEVEKERGPWR